MGSRKRCVGACKSGRRSSRRGHGPEAERLTLVDDTGRVLSDSEGLLALLSLVLRTSTGREVEDVSAAGDVASYSSWPSASAGIPAGERRRGEETAGAPVGEPSSIGRRVLSLGLEDQPGEWHVGGEGGPAAPGPESTELPESTESEAIGRQGVLRVALPVSAPGPVEDMCRRAGAALIWTKLSASHLMEVASRPGVAFAAGQEGGYIFPRFLPAYDAIAALVHTFALLATTGAKLSRVVTGLPPAFTAHEGVVTPWEKKGTVMRAVMELSKDRPTVLVDGVKVLYDDGWCLVVPDPEEPLTHVWAEATTEATALRRAQDYARQVRNVLRG